MYYLLIAILALTASTQVHAQTVTYPPAVLPVTADVRSAVVTLDASGNATWNISPAFDGIPDVTHIASSLDGTNPIICNYTTRTASQVTVHCWRTSLLGLLTNLFAGSVTGAQVNLIARYKAP